MSKYKSLLLSILVMALWGCLFPLVKLGYKEYGIVTTSDILCFAGVRFVICGALITLYSSLTDKKSFDGVKSSILPILLSGLLAIVLHYSFTYSAMQITDSSKTAILKQIGVLLYVCFSFVFIRDDKPTPRKITGAILGFVGIIAINTGNGKVSFNLGDALIIGASLSTVFSNVISKKLFLTIKPLAATGISQLLGGVILSIVGFVCGGNILFIGNGNIMLFALICVFSIVGYSIWFVSVKNGELSKLFIIKFLEPMFACVFSAAILGEDIFKLQYLAAFVLISLGIFISENKTC